MQSELLFAFEEQVTDLRKRLPGLRGESLRESAAQLESLTEFLELIDLIGGRRLRPAGQGETSAAPTA